MVKYIQYYAIKQIVRNWINDRRGVRREEEADRASRGASESRICSARNPAVCAQIGCYLSAAGDRAHRGPRARAFRHIHQQSRLPPPSHTYVRPLINVRWELYRSWHRSEVQGRALSFRPPSPSSLLASVCVYPTGYPPAPSPARIL